MWLQPEPLQVERVSAKPAILREVTFRKLYESGWAPGARGARLFFSCWGAARFFFAVGARQVRSLTCCRPPPSIHCRKASRVRGAFFLLRVRELWGGAFILCCGCAARLFFCCGCASSLTHSLAARRPKSTNSKKAHTTKKTRVLLGAVQLGRGSPAPAGTRAPLEAEQLRKRVLGFLALLAP